MARITLEANTKDRYNKSGQLVFTQGDIRIKLFDGKHSDSGESYSDGLTMDAFRRMVNQKKNWVMINSKFSITNGGRTVEAREVYYDDGVVKVREANSPMNERVYEMDDALIQSFSTVCVQTIDNNVDREMRRQNKATSKEEMMADRTGTNN